tara:strand:+ start:2302 stop:2457 length:156 start_codon:yes stop_codon:yes gene_type:complete
MLALFLGRCSVLPQVSAFRWNIFLGRAVILVFSHSLSAICEFMVAEFLHDA